MRSDPAVEYVNSTLGRAGPTRSSIRAFSLRPSRERIAASSRCYLSPLVEANGPACSFFRRSKHQSVGRRPWSYSRDLQGEQTETLYSVAPNCGTSQDPGFSRRHTISTSNPQIVVRSIRESGCLWRHTTRFARKLYNAWLASFRHDLYPANAIRSLETLPNSRRRSDLKRPCPTSNGTVALSAVTRSSPLSVRLVVNTSAIPAVDNLIHLRPASHFGGGDAITALSGRKNLPASITTGFQGLRRCS